MREIFLLQHRPPTHNNIDTAYVEKIQFLFRLNSYYNSIISIYSISERKKMLQRINYREVAPGAFRAMLGLEKYLSQSNLEPSLQELVKLRASQINGCAYCIDMHTKDARASGESEQRLYGLSAWQDAPYYTERERAALAWTEALTLIADNQVEDELYEQVQQHFNEAEVVDLTMSIIAINGWNRFAISFKTEVGHYQPMSRG